jgi:hypothetical protein
VPVIKILKRLLVGDVVSKYDCVSLVDVGLDHFTKDTLAPDVPDLQRDVDVPWELEPFNEEVNTDCLFVAASEMIFTKAHDKTRLSHSTITEHHNFILEIFGLAVTFRRLLGLRKFLVFLIFFIFLDHNY